MVEHDQIVEAGIELVKCISLEQVVEAFICSLSTRNLPARSAFGSYLVLKHLQSHEFVCEADSKVPHCDLCGLRENLRFGYNDDVAEKKPLTMPTDIAYAVADLKSFASRKLTVVSDEDIAILKSLLGALRELPAGAQLKELSKAWQGIIKSNKLERMYMLETFGFAGILCPDDQQSYQHSFVSYLTASFTQPAAYYKREWQYPVRFWTGADGVKEAAVSMYFGNYLHD